MPDGVFTLRDLLQQTTPIATKEGASFFTLDRISSVEQERLLYFAASIFWRAAVIDWETPIGHYTKLAIQPKDVEELRKYLLGPGPFPTDLTIIIVLSASASPIQSTILPNITPGPSEYHQFDWYMPGIGFALLAGKVPAAMQAISMSRSPHYIAIDATLDKRMMAAGVKHAQESTATNKLQKKIDQKGSTST
jgi:hypothetical protein